MQNAAKSFNAVGNVGNVVKAIKVQVDKETHNMHVFCHLHKE